MFRNLSSIFFVFGELHVAQLWSCLTSSCPSRVINLIYYPLLSFFCLLFLVSLSPQEANQFLSRHRRANQVFEETKQGHLERECVEERCTQEEAREVFENDPETVSITATSLQKQPKRSLKLHFAHLYI